MTDLGPAQENLVGDVLSRHWRIKEPTIRTPLGVSRATWRVGKFYWLAQAEHVRFAELSRQAKLLTQLNKYLNTESISLSIPEIIASRAGHVLVHDAGYVWCLTRHLPGFHPAVNDAGVYSALTEGLARFHRIVRAFPKSESLHVPDGICVRTRQTIDRLTSDAFVAFTSDPREEHILQSAAAWLLPRLDSLERLPRQIVHGDWTPRNVLFQRDDREMHLTGVLDFEEMAWDPVCVDVANTCSTLLMWSGLDRLEERIEDVVKTYEHSAGVEFEREDVHTAMLAHWFCHYWNWRDRLQSGEFGHEVKDRLCSRISSVLSYLADGGGVPHR
jgi:Ser/Thr protein kinase RdoA (MazF antagonist)